MAAQRASGDAVGGHTQDSAPKSKLPKEVKLAMSLSQDDGNYLEWAYVMESAMKKYGLYGVLSDPNSPITEQDRADLIHLINMNVNSDLLPVVMECNGDPRRAWDALKTETLGTTEQDKANLHIEIGITKMPSDATLVTARNHFAAMNKAVRQPKMAGTPYPKIRAATDIVLSLPGGMGSTALDSADLGHAIDSQTCPRRGAGHDQTNEDSSSPDHFVHS